MASSYHLACGMTCEHFGPESIGNSFLFGQQVLWCERCGATRLEHETKWTHPWMVVANVTHAPPPAVGERSLMWKRIDALAEAFEEMGEKVEDCLKFIEYISEAARVQASRRSDRESDS